MEVLWLTLKHYRMIREASGRIASWGRVLTTGRPLHSLFLLQSFLVQAVLPWPSKMPLPFSVKWSRFWMVTQLSPFIWAGSAGALRVPCSWTVIELLQGPCSVTLLSAYVPAGIKIVLGLGELHASVHAVVKTFRITRRTSRQKNENKKCQNS